jgi:hypothetical protein
LGGKGDGERGFAGLEAAEEDKTMTQENMNSNNNRVEKSPVELLLYCRFVATELVKRSQAESNLI